MPFCPAWTWNDQMETSMATVRGEEPSVRANLSAASLRRARKHRVSVYITIRGIYIALRPRGRALPTVQECPFPTALHLFWFGDDPIPPKFKSQPQSVCTCLESSVLFLEGSRPNLKYCALTYRPAQAKPSFSPLPSHRHSSPFALILRPVAACPVALSTRAQQRMSLSRNRLGEERKLWRKDHPYVYPSSLCCRVG